MSSIRVELPLTRILVLAKSDDLEVAARAIRCGADGFLVKTVAQSALEAFAYGLQYDDKQGHACQNGR